MPATRSKPSAEVEVPVEDKTKEIEDSPSKKTRGKRNSSTAEDKPVEETKLEETEEKTKEETDGKVDKKEEKVVENETVKKDENGTTETPAEVIDGKAESIPAVDAKSDAKVESPVKKVPEAGDKVDAEVTSDSPKKRVAEDGDAAAEDVSPEKKCKLDEEVEKPEQPTEA